MKISIVTPSYNQGQFIGRTIESVASQARNNFTVEHVVFDGGSTDNTVEVLKEYGSQLMWVSEKDGGQAHAVNKGIKSTDGNIIGWLNSDDIYYPDAFIKVAEYFKNNPEVDILYGKADHIDLQDFAFEEYPTEPWDFDRLKFTCFICQPALFFRRKVAEEYGLLDESLNYCMDYEYWLRLGGRGLKFAYLEEKLAGSRLYADNKTIGSRVKVHKEINDMYRKRFGGVPDRWILNYIHAFTDKNFKGISGKRRIYLLSALTIIFSFYWNHAINKNLMTQIRSWWI